MKLLDITKQKFNRLTAIKFDHTGKYGEHFWLFCCECGRKKIIVKRSVISGKTQSCGCLHKERVKVLGLKNGTHKLSKSRFYRIWFEMKKRCNKKNHISYKNYGGKGIRVCSRWVKFEGFRDDMYRGYIEHVKKYGEKNTSIDRVNNSQDYCKYNVKWSTRIEQSNNTNRNFRIKFNGHIKTLSEWAREYQLKPHTLRRRIVSGWFLGRAMDSKKYINQFC